MTINSLYPSFVQIHYHSGWGKHVQTIPTKQWHAPSAGHPSGTFDIWSGSTMDAETMIDDLVNFIKAVAGTQTAWDFAIIFNFPAVPPATPNPVAIYTLTQVGVVTFTAAAIAIQNTYTFFDTGFNTFKFITLDMDASFTLQPVSFGGLDSAHQAIVTELENNGRGWSSRGNLRPGTLRSVVSKPNDKLRKEYHLK